MTVNTVKRMIMAWFITVGLFLVSMPALANDPQAIEFEVSPKRCITLRKGQPCYAKVKFKWRSSEAVSVCVKKIDREDMKCWTSSVSGSLVLAQSLGDTTEYVLTDEEGEVLDTASISVLWSYRKKRTKRKRR